MQPALIGYVLFLLNFQGIIRALREEQDIRKGLRSPSDKREVQPYFTRDPQKRVVQQTRRHDRTTDIEDTKEV